MSPLRVAYDTTATTLSRTGPARYVLELGSALDRRPEVEVVRVSQGSPPRRGVADRLAAGLAREALYYPFQLAQRARAARADLIHCPAALAPRSGGLPLVLTLHDAIIWRHPELFRRAHVVHANWLVADAARRATRILTGTEFSRAEISRLLGIDPERIAVTSYGIASRFTPAEVDDDWLERRFRIRRPYVLAVGTLEPRKNLGAAVRAVARARQTIPELGLVVAGPPGWGASGLDSAAPADEVVSTGFVADAELPRLYSGAACFVYPSLVEGFGLPPLEAMACGTPVVASDRSCLPETLGDAALLVDPADVGALADAIGRVVADPALARDLSERGIARARGFTWEATAAATVRAYEQALARSS